MKFKLCDRIKDRPIFDLRNLNHKTKTLNYEFGSSTYGRIIINNRSVLYF